MDYKYIEQLLDRYFECLTSLEEEQILRVFFAQENIPMHLLPYRELFAEETWEKSRDSLGKDFDQRILSIINNEEMKEPVRVKARKITISKRLRPFYKAAACVAIVLALGQAAQMPYNNTEREEQENLANTLEQLQQIQKDNNAVAKSDSAKMMQQNNNDVAPLAN